MVSATSISLQSTFTAETNVDVGLNCPPESGWWAANARLTLVPLQSQGTYPVNNYRRTARNQSAGFRAVRITAAWTSRTCC